MRRLLAIGLVIGTGAIGFAAAPQAGVSLRTSQSLTLDGSSPAVAGKADAQTCRIEKTLKYDFSGNPYIKKVRICA